METPIVQLLAAGVASLIMGPGRLRVAGPFFGLGYHKMRAKRRKRDVRCKTLPIKRMTLASLAISPEDVALLASTPRPKTRADCVDGPRPCPWASCRFHLYLDVTRTGIKVNFPDIDLDGMPETCVLDVADAGAASLEEAGEIMNLTRERIRQIESRATKRLLPLLPRELL